MIPPLIIAAWTEDVNAIERLLKNHHVNVNVQDTNGATALHLAAMKCNPLIVDMLLEAGADPNIMDEEGDLPIDNLDMEHPNAKMTFLAFHMDRS
jgi:ankyrin repeat protein